MKRILTLIILMALAQAGLAQQAPTPIATPPTLAPVMNADQQMQFEDTHLISAQRDFFGVSFRLNGQDIHDEKELERIIASAEDEQAYHYLKDAEDHYSVGWLLIGGGSGMMLVGGLMTWSNGNQTLSNVLILGGLGLDTLGGLLYRASQSEQMDAVARYNQIIRQDNGISLLSLPREQAMGLAFVQRF
ncbi:MAG TPA: hypothetical protein VK791_03480 [bacterium]|jgi:hypothetical protein|nr:hypothetical protein [bacterium]